MAVNMSMTEELFMEIVDVLRWYADAKWGWNDIDESVVRTWDSRGGRWYPLEHVFKDGGNVARKMIEKLESQLLYHLL